MIRVLFIGDIVGEPGIRSLEKGLPEICSTYQPDLVVANAENAAADGRGISFTASERLWDLGIEILTLGNHTWDHRDMMGRLHNDLRIVRPANYPGAPPGQGFTFVKVKNQEVLIVNLLGRAFMATVDCPFRKLDEILDKEGGRTPHILVDLHAETTSEKLAMAWDFNGKVSAILGTHTHVPTADERILPGGTGIQTDIGMCGPYNGVIGVKSEAVIRKFRSQLPVRFEVDSSTDLQLNATLLDLAEDGKCVSIQRVQKIFT